MNREAHIIPWIFKTLQKGAKQDWSHFTLEKWDYYNYNTPLWHICLRMRRSLIKLLGLVKAGTKSVTGCLGAIHFQYETKMCFSEIWKIWDSVYIFLQFIAFPFLWGIILARHYKSAIFLYWDIGGWSWIIKFQLIFLEKSPVLVQNST